MSWQAMMKHEAGCPALSPVLCNACPHFGKQYCDNNPCPTVGVGCTCRRDETVAAIEAALEALRDISESRGCVVRRSQERGGESKDYLDGCEIAYERCADTADAALDRLNALAGGASGKEVVE